MRKVYKSQLKDNINKEYQKAEQVKSLTPLSLILPESEKDGDELANAVQHLRAHKLAPGKSKS